MRGVLTALTLALLLGAGAAEAQADAPTLLVGTINRSTVKLYFSEALDTTQTLDMAKFTVTSTDGSLGVVSSPTFNSDEPHILTLTVATAVNNIPSVTIDIFASSGIQDTANNALAAVTSFLLTNLQRSSPGKPHLLQAAVDGTTLTLTYGQTLLPRFPPPGDFTVSATATTTTVSSVAINPRVAVPTVPRVVATVVLTLSTAVQATDTVTLSYTKTNAPQLQNPWGAQADALTNEAVSNHTGGIPVASISGGSAVTEGTNAVFTVTLSKASARNVIVNLTITQERDFVARSQLGPKAVRMGKTTGPVNYSVSTIPDSTDEPDGRVIATLTTGYGYTVHATNKAASVTVKDDDVPPPPDDDGENPDDENPGDSGGENPGGGGGGGGGGSGGGGGGSSVRDRHGNSAARATPIAFQSATPRSGSIAGHINTRSDVDYFRLRLAQAGVLLLETNGRTDTRGQVWQAGEELGAATDGGPGTNFRLATPVEADDVVIAIAGEGGATGAYTLRARLVAGSVENPSPTSFQSGLGLISGWVCEAEGVAVEIEKADGTVVELAAAYGTERADTAAICGDSDNGFGVLVNWNLLDDGAHAVRVLVNGVALGTRAVPGVGVVPAVVDGIELGRAPVTVTTLGAEFVEGLQGSLLVADFPRTGEQVRVVWQESQQNFVLAPAEGRAVAGPGPGAGGIDGVLENPRPASYQSGIGVISGWVCEAEEVVIEIDGQPIAAAAGTERADTLDRCGDVDTGFGLLVNWAEFGAGAHEVVALVDGVELSRATVTVTLVDEAEPFVRGLTKRVELPGFPTPDETVTLEWQERQQNFVITGVD